MEKISLKWLKENKPEFLKGIELHKGSIDKFAPYGKYEYGTVEYRVISCIGMCESIACYGPGILTNTFIIPHITGLKKMLAIIY